MDVLSGLFGQRQLIFSVLLVKVSMYTYAGHLFAHKLLGICIWSYIALGLSAGLEYGAIAFLNFCGVAIRLDNANPPRGWKRWLVIFIFASLLVTNIYWIFRRLKPLAIQESSFEPFSAMSIINVTMVLVFGTYFGFYLLYSLSARMGPNFIISFHRIPHSRLAPANPTPLETPATQISRQTDSSGGEEEGDPILQASVHFSSRSPCCFWRYPITGRFMIHQIW